MLVYEVGVLSQPSHQAQQLIAQSMIQGVLAWFGIAGVWVPGVVLLVSLLVWHRAAGDRWRLRPWVVGGILIEGVVVALPLLLISGLFAAGPTTSDASLITQALISLGAGIYEELVFRFLLISGLVWLLAEGAGWKGTGSSAVAIALAAATFALCHFHPVGTEVFTWQTFGFKLAAGVYLSALYLTRGLGVASSTHVAYNLLLVVLHRSGG